MTEIWKLVGAEPAEMWFSPLSATTRDALLARSKGRVHGHVHGGRQDGLARLD